MKLKVKINPECPNEMPILDPAKLNDSGYDLVSWVDTKNGIIKILPYTFMNIRTGASIKLPVGYWGDVRPRSSTFTKRHLIVMNSVIDQDYVGEISYVVWNADDVEHTIKNGDRIAQLVLLPRTTPPLQIVNNLPKTVRNTAGFGSTGL